MMDIGLDLPSLIQDNSFYDLSERIANKIDVLLNEALLSLKQHPPSYMKMSSPLNDAHMDLVIATFQSHILSRGKLLADRRIAKAKEYKDEVQKAIIKRQQLSQANLPRELILNIVQSIGDTSSFSVLLNTYHTLPMQSPDFNRTRQSNGLIYVDGWKAHRVDMSLPIMAHIDSDISKKALEKLLLCKSVNLSVCFNEGSLLEKSLPILLKYPRKWKSLELQIFSQELSSFLSRCSLAIPYLTYLSITLLDGVYDRNPNLTPISRSIRKDGTKLQEATLCWSLLKPLRQLGLLTSVTSLSISSLQDGSEHQMLDSLQLISDLPNLAELEFLASRKKVNDNHTSGARSVRCPRLRSVSMKDVHPTFFYYSLPLFKETRLVRLHIESCYSGSRFIVNRDMARAIHESIPGLAELNFTCKYRPDFFTALAECGPTGITLLPSLRRLIILAGIRSGTKDALLELINARKTAPGSLPIATLEVYSLPDDPLLKFELERLVPSLTVSSSEINEEGEPVSESESEEDRDVSDDESDSSEDFIW